MNYKLELNKQGAGPNIIFHNIIFDFFNVIIVERYPKFMSFSLSPDFVIFKIKRRYFPYLQRNGKGVKFLRIPKQNHQ